MRVIFIGSGEFALAPFLNLAHSSKHEIAAVFTKAPQKSGRGLKRKKNIIHRRSEEFKIAVYIFSKIGDQEAISLIKSIKSDIVVVVSYNQIIPSEILWAKKYGAINIHPSLLPKYRGASPIQSAILNRDLQTGLCIIQMDEGLDTGDILAQTTFQLTKKYDFVSLSRELSIIGSNLLLDMFEMIDNIKPVSQISQGQSYVQKIYKEEAAINWEWDKIEEIDAKIRALGAYNKFTLEFRGRKFNIIKALVLRKGEYKEKLGQVIINQELSKNLLVVCMDGILELLVIKPLNSKEVFSKDFLNGLRGNL